MMFHLCLLKLYNYHLSCVQFLSTTPVHRSTVYLTRYMQCMLAAAHCAMYIDVLQGLPIFKLRDALIKAVNENQILIVIGETGMYVWKVEYVCTCICIYACIRVQYYIIILQCVYMEYTVDVRVSVYFCKHVHKSVNLWLNVSVDMWIWCSRAYI